MTCLLSSASRGLLKEIGATHTKWKKCLLFVKKTEDEDTEEEEEEESEQQREEEEMGLERRGGADCKMCKMLPF